MASSQQALSTLLYQLRASYQVYRNSHWTVGKNDYYGNHLLLQRLYEETEKQIDTLAEMMVGTYGPKVIRGHRNETSKWVEKFTVADPMKSSLRAAKAVRASIDTAYSTLERNGELDTGWEDLLPALASQKDSHLYLLQQATGTPAPRAGKKRGKKTGKKSARKKNPISARSLVSRALK